MILFLGGNSLSSHCDAVTESLPRSLLALPDCWRTKKAAEHHLHPGGRPRVERRVLAQPGHADQRHGETGPGRCEAGAVLQSAGLHPLQGRSAHREISFPHWETEGEEILEQICHIIIPDRASHLETVILARTICPNIVTESPEASPADWTEAEPDHSAPGTEGSGLLHSHGGQVAPG